MQMSTQESFHAHQYLSWIRMRGQVLSLSKIAGISWWHILVPGCGMSGFQVAQTFQRWKECWDFFNSDFYCPCLETTQEKTDAIMPQFWLILLTTPMAALAGYGIGGPIVRLETVQQHHRRTCAHYNQFRVASSLYIHLQLIDVEFGTGMNWAFLDDRIITLLLFSWWTRLTFSERSFKAAHGQQPVQWLIDISCHNSCIPHPKHQHPDMLHLVLLWIPLYALMAGPCW